MIILDFDGVLFNDECFKRDYQRLFARFGISPVVYRSGYARTKSAHGGYSPDTHLAILRQEAPALRIRDVAREIEHLLAWSALYLYRDAGPFLSYWKTRGEPLILASSGFAFQKKKVRASGTLPFFQRTLIIESASKVKPLAEILARHTGELIVFIDDKKAVVDEVKQNFPNLLVLQMVRRGGQEISVCADAIVSNLAGARRLIVRRWDAIQGGGARSGGVRAYSRPRIQRG